MEEFQDILRLISQSRFFHILKISGWMILVLSWLGMTSFVLKDSEKRYFKKTLQSAVVLLPLFLHIVGFFIYFLIRPAKTKAEKLYEEELLGIGAHDLSTCPFCHTEIRESFVFCPQCGKEIFEHCENCGKPMRKGWKHCPYCRKAKA